MIIYRPHRGGLAEAMREAKVFDNQEQMRKYIVAEHTDSEFGPAFSEDDIVIDDKPVNDTRNGWKDTRYVCVERYYKEDFVEKYGCPQCIGMCATQF